MCVDVSLENRCKHAQMANFLLARAETGARGKVFLWGEARAKKGRFLSTFTALPHGTL